MFVWLFALRCSGQSGNICSCNPLITSTTTFRDCTFQGCESNDGREDGGGAISVQDSSIGLGITHCFFLDCEADMGGGILSYCLWFKMNTTSAFRCSAQSLGGFCLVTIYDRGAMDVSETSTADCNCKGATIALESHAEAEPLLLTALNSTMNSGDAATGLVSMDDFSCSIHYSTFCNNYPGGCVAVMTKSPNSSISCLGFLNNTCTAGSASGETLSWLLLFGSTLTISDSIFQSNTFRYFVIVEAFNSRGRKSRIGLIRCIFDCDRLNHTGSMELHITDCAFSTKAAVAVGSGACPSGADSGGRSGTAAAVILSVVVVVVVVGSLGAVVAVWFLRWRNHRDEARDGLVENAEHRID
jgi:hypothetical protein